MDDNLIHLTTSGKVHGEWEFYCPICHYRARYREPKEGSPGILSIIKGDNQGRPFKLPSRLERS